MERNKEREEGEKRKDAGGRMLEEEEEKGGGDELGWVCVTRGAVSLSPRPLAAPPEILTLTHDDSRWRGHGWEERRTGWR